MSLVLIIGHSEHGTRIVSIMFLAGPKKGPKNYINLLVFLQGKPAVVLYPIFYANPINTLLKNSCVVAQRTMEKKGFLEVDQVSGCIVTRREARPVPIVINKRANKI
jgi:hypothetical protein